MLAAGLHRGRPLQVEIPRIAQGLGRGSISLVAYYFFYIHDIARLQALVL